MTQLSEQEKFRRRETVRDTRAALATGDTLERRQAKRDTLAQAWAVWLRHRMDNTGCSAMELLPDALAQLETMIDDRVAVAVNELKSKLREVLR
jgi:hypothetical protein